jgi:hypothetical protein
MEQRVAIKFCVKLKKTATERFKFWKVHMVKNVYLEQVCLDSIKGSEKGESHYKTNIKAISQLPEQQNREKSFKSVWPKTEVWVFRH